MDKMLKASGGVDFERACKQCVATLQSETADNCNANSTVNLYAGNKGALLCLDNKRGDYAVLTLDHRLKENLTLPEGTKVMCRNGSLSDTLDVDDPCFLAVVPTGGVIGNTTNSNFKDIQLALMELAKTSGATSSFNIFDRFQGVDNLLFPNLLHGFVVPYEKNSSDGDVSNKYIQIYETMLNSIDKCDVRPRKLENQHKSSNKSIELNSTDKSDVGPRKPKPEAKSSIVLLVLGLISIAMIAGVVFWLKKMASSNMGNNSKVDNTEEPQERQPLYDHTQSSNTQAQSDDSKLTSQDSKV